MRRIPDQAFSYSEEILHGIWEQLLFNTSALRTRCGKALQILNPGTLNKTDGPDFKRAALLIGDIQWYGDVELHVHSNEWMHHGHHRDPNYNQVILHVVAEQNPTSVQCLNEAEPFTLNLFPLLNKGLHHFIKRDQQKELPCSRAFTYLAPEAIEKQILHAHKEYLNRKIHDFLQHFEAGTPKHSAWKQALIISLFDGLGIPHNRHPMQELARHAFKAGFPSTFNLEEILELSGIHSAVSRFNWNYKSVRPSSHPSKRIPQAVKLGNAILTKKSDWFADIDPEKSWKKLLEEAEISTNRILKVLYGTVYLPSLYVMGNFFIRKDLSQRIYREWMQLKSPVPESTLNRLQDLANSNSITRHKLGSVYQLRSYCDEGRCFECFILKNAIQS